MAQATLDLNLRLKNIDSKLNQLDDKVGKAGDKAGKKFSAGFAKGFVGAAVVLKGTQLLTAAFGDAVQSARDFSRTIAEVNTILPKTEKLTKATKDEFIELGKAFGTDASLQVKSYYNVVSAGISGTAKQLRVLTTANEAALAGITDIGSATNVIVSTMNSYSKAGITSQEVSDTLFSTVKEGLTTFEELSSTLGNVVPIASNVGVSFQEVAGTIGFITKGGVRTAAAVTQLRAALISILKPTGEAKTEAQRLGLEFNSTALKTKGLGKFLADLKNKTGGNVDSLTRLFGSAEATSAIMAILNGNFSDYNRILGATKDATGATTEAMNIMKDSLDFKLKQVTADFKALGLQLANATVPIILTATTAIRDAFNATKLEIKAPEETLEGFNAEMVAIQGMIDKLKEENEIGEFDFFDRVFGKEEENSNRIEALKLSLKSVQEQKDEFIKNSFVGPMPLIQAAPTIAELKKVRASLDKTSAQAKKTSGIIHASLSTGVTNSILSLTNSLRTGANAFEAFGGAVANMMGDMMINVGKSIIMQSTAVAGLRATLLTLFPGAGLAAGAALVLAGGLMKNAGASLTSAATSGASASVTEIPEETLPITDSPITEETSTLEDIEERQTQTAINVTIQGDVLDSEETGTRIVNLINNAFDGQGVVLNQGLA